MTIWQIIIWWLIGEVISWVLFWKIAQKVILMKVEDFGTRIMLEQKMGDYPCTQNRIAEWVRFVIFPYGIIQRSIVIGKMIKEAKMNE